MSFQVAGRIANVNVDPGQSVRRGEVVASIELTALTKQLAVAESRLIEALAVENEATRRITRLRGLVETGAAAESERDAAVSAAESAIAIVQAVRAERDALVWQREQGELRAPFDGMVALRLIEPGQSVGPGVPAIAIDGNGRELRVPVPAAQAAGLRVGDAAVAYGVQSQLKARVLQIGQRQHEGGLVEVNLELLEGGAPGQVMPVRFAGAGDAALWVPVRAVVPSSKEGEGHVMRYQPDIGQAIRIDVRYGMAKGDLLQIVSGLETGELVVARGAGFIGDGMAVKPIDDAR
jgi:RND family efflux transporter MFP subunit